MSDQVTDIGVLALNVRILNNLICGGYHTVEKLLEADSGELLRVPGIGKESLNMIGKALKRFRKLVNPEQQMLQDIGSKLMAVERKVNMLSEMMEKLAVSKLGILAEEVQGMRTIMLEQYRLLQSIQLEKSPDGLLRKINEKVPGFSATVYDLYHKLEQM
jgi:hypothetical protein